MSLTPARERQRDDREEEEETQREIGERQIVVRLDAIGVHTAASVAVGKVPFWEHNRSVTRSRCATSPSPCSAGRCVRRPTHSGRVSCKSDTSVSWLRGQSRHRVSCACALASKDVGTGPAPMLAKAFRPRQLDGALKTIFQAVFIRIDRLRSWCSSLRLAGPLLALASRKSASCFGGRRLWMCCPRFNRRWPELLICRVLDDSER